MDPDVGGFGRLFSRFVEQMAHAAQQQRTSPLRDLLDPHLGEDCSGLLVVSESFMPYDHVNVQVAVDAYLAEAGRTFELHGATGQQRHDSSFSDLIRRSRWDVVGLGSMDFENLPIGPEETLACVRFGLYLIDDHGRADLLEPALAARPGRVDLAVEIAPPDRDARRRLLELYGRGLALRLDDIDAVVERTRGVTASFIKELMRKAALVAADRAVGDGGIEVIDRDVSEALDELLSERSALTRVLLGGSQPGAQPSGATDWLTSDDEA